MNYMIQNFNKIKQNLPENTDEWERATDLLHAIGGLTLYLDWGNEKIN